MIPSLSCFHNIFKNLVVWSLVKLPPNLGLIRPLVRNKAITGSIGFITITVHESAPLNVPSEMLRPLNAGPCSGHVDES
mgnify:CR=1 FL=1